MSDMLNVSVVIPNNDRGEEVLECIDSIQDSLLIAISRAAYPRAKTGLPHVGSGGV